MKRKGWIPQHKQIVCPLPDRLEIDSSLIRVKDETGAELEISGFENLEQFHFYRINLKQNLTAGKIYTVDIPQFTGKIRSNGEGLYWSSYVDGNQRMWDLLCFMACYFANACIVRLLELNLQMTKVQET